MNHKSAKINHERIFYNLVKGSFYKHDTNPEAIENIKIKKKKNNLYDTMPLMKY